MEDESGQYLNRLCSLGIRQLSVEPQRLADEYEATVKKTQELAFTNYKSLIAAAQCERDVSCQFDNIESKLNDLTSKIPTFSSKASAFGEDAKRLSKRWREASLMLSKHHQILEFLEIPQLMDTCVKNCCYEEALQLYAYVQKLNVKYGSTVPLVTSIFAEATGIRENMTSQLVKELYTNIQLPQLIKIVACLRKLEAFTETELRVKFLIARDAWLQSLVKDVPTRNPLTYISKLTEVNRVNLFDIVTQYRAVFADDEHYSSSFRLYGQLSNRESGINDHAILPSWISHRINEYLGLLEQNLEKCVITEIGHHPFDTLIDPCFYFGLSLSRIGADFRPMLSKLFAEAFFKRFKLLMDKAFAKFQNSFENYTFKAIKEGKNLDLTPTEDNASSFNPPAELTQFLPLANLCNDILSAFNEFRHMLPVSIMQKTSKLLEEKLCCVSDCICNYYRTENSAFTEEENLAFQNFCMVYVFSLLPHLQKCLTALWPPELLVKLLGISLLEFRKLKSSNSDFLTVELNIEVVVHPLMEALPQGVLRVSTEDDQSIEDDDLDEKQLSLSAVTD